MNQINVEKFFSVYSEKLRETVLENPKDYCWPVENVPVVVERMKNAALSKSFGWDSLSFKKTCKEIGIKHQYKEIIKYLEV